MSRHTRPFKHTNRIPIHGGGKKMEKRDQTGAEMQISFDKGAFGYQFCLLCNTNLNVNCPLCHTISM